jgi:hypothetical protein
VTLTPRLQMTAAGLPVTVTGKSVRINVGRQP